MRSVRALPALPALVLVLSSALAWASTSATAGATTGAEVTSALAVLHRWDAARSRAWVRADAGALRRLYVAGSGAGAADVRLLRRYSARGVRVSWLDTQVFSVDVRRSRPNELRLVVIDRVVGAVTTRRQCMPLPVESPARRVVDLRRDDGAWRVVGVS